MKDILESGGILRSQTVGREMRSFSPPIREHFLCNSPVPDSPTDVDVVLTAAVRTDPAPSAGGDTDLHRVQLRW